MAKRELERTAQQSVLDRLIDHDPGTSADIPPTFSESVRMLKDAVRRDLSWLLNSRRIPDLAPDALQELGKSVYHYGLPDFTSLSVDAPDTRSILIRQVEEAIARYEPRLANVHVSITEEDGATKRELRFVIEGLLKMEPSPEQVAFDTVLETMSGKFELS